MMSRLNLANLFSVDIRPQFLVKAIAVAGFSLGISIFGNIHSAEAAEKVVLNYGSFGRSITIEELEEFVDTGKQTPTLKFILKAAKQDPAQVRQFFSKEIQMSPKLLDDVLNILPGEYALFMAGRIFHTPARVANDKALRSAIILSTVDDRKISVLEFLQKYPTREFYVDGYRAADTAGNVVKLVNTVGDKLAGPIAVVTDVLDDIVCDCQNP